MQRVHVLRARAPPSRLQRRRRRNDDVLRRPARRGVACRQAGGARGHSRRCSSSPHCLGLVREARAQRVPRRSVSRGVRAYTGVIHALTETLPTWFRGEILIVDDASSPETVGDLQQLADATPNASLLRTMSTPASSLLSIAPSRRPRASSSSSSTATPSRSRGGCLRCSHRPAEGTTSVRSADDSSTPTGGSRRRGLVFRDGSAAKFGYGDREPDFPLFTVPREVDYCSGCLLPSAATSSSNQADSTRSTASASTRTPTSVFALAPSAASSSTNPRA